MYFSGVFAFVISSMVVGMLAQRSPYLHSSDPGVLPMYLPEGSENRIGDDTEVKEPPKIQEGTLETEDLYNRVADWPDQRKPFWYLNAAALQNQREQQQQQSQDSQAQPQNRQSQAVQAQPQNRQSQAVQAQAQNRQSPLISTLRRGSSSRQN